MITAQELKNILLYEEETGNFRRLTKYGDASSAGEVAGTINSKGYVQIRIKNKKFSAHRLAWLYVYGHMPSSPLDHKDRCKTNNKICNLRLATASENAQNIGVRSDNKTGFKGVTLNNRDKKYAANIKLHGKQKYLGSFNSAEEAYRAYCNAASEIHTRNPSALPT